MKGINKNFLILLLTSVFLFNFTTPCLALDTDDSQVHIIEDSDNASTVPVHFRKTSNLDRIKNLKIINTKGMEKLNISGSGQFTVFNLPIIKDQIGGSFNIIDIDLRQESHGFVNGIAISFENKKNNANEGLTLNEVIETENKDLASIKLGVPLTLYNTNKEIIPKSVRNELSVTQANDIAYYRIPVTDGGLPKEDMINLFVNIVKNQPKNSWMHFHCKEGIGRTTTFMIMYDIMKNCNEVSLQDIVLREVMLSDISLKDKLDFFGNRRYNFLKDFYNKCKEGDFALSENSFIF